MIKKLTSFAALAFYSAIGTVHAAGLKPVEDMGNSVIETIDSIAPFIIIAALVVAGALIAFRAAGMGVVVGIVAGGVLIANAPEITTWFGL